jgi:cytochrome P450
MLMASVAEQAKSDNEPMDIVRWLNFTTFDIIGDLAFSESFRSLESRAHNPWVLSIFRGLRGAAFLAMLSQYPIFQFLIKGLELSSSIKQFDEILNHARNKAKARMSYGSKRFERKDFMTYMLDGPDGKPGMETEEILQNGPVLVIAGSETVATAMAGFFFYAGQHPEVYAKAAMEIRSAFNSESEISIAQVTSLRYLTAVIQETLRIYPPAPVTPERLSPGDTINGNYVPAGVLNILESPVTKGDAHTNS